MFVIRHSGLGCYLFGFRWTGEPMFSELGLAIKFETRREAKKYARLNAVKGVVIVEILPKPKNEKEK